MSISNLFSFAFLFDFDGEKCWELFIFYLLIFSSIGFHEGGKMERL
jgi:hypothetical protein